MIKKTPPIYPHESVHSWLARTYSQSGHIYHRYFAKEIFLSRKERIDYSFINRLSPGFRGIVEQTADFKDLLLNHTLFKHYARFIRAEERKEAYEIGIHNEDHLVGKLHIPPFNMQNRLRYCPACVQGDRDHYGEAYFHIEHQIFEMRICPIHRVRLIDTEIHNNKAGDSTFFTLEQLDPQAESHVVYEKSDINYLISKYIYEIFQKDISIDGDVLISDYLSSLLDRAYCVDNARTKKNIIKLSNDISLFYKDLEIKNLKPHRICGVYRGANINPYDILLIAYFHRVKPKDLSLLKLPKEAIRRPIMRRVYDLYREGFSAPQIANMVGRNENQVQRIIGGYCKITKKAASPGRPAPANKH